MAHETLFSFESFRKAYKSLRDVSESDIQDATIWDLMDEGAIDLKTKEGIYALFVTRFMDRGCRSELIGSGLKDLWEMGILKPDTLKDSKHEFVSVLENHDVKWKWPGRTEGPEQIFDYLKRCIGAMDDRYSGDLNRLKRRVTKEVALAELDPKSAVSVSVKWIALELASLPWIGEKQSTLFLREAISDYGAWDDLEEGFDALPVSLDIHVVSFFDRFSRSNEFPKNLKSGKKSESWDWYIIELAEVMATLNGTTSQNLDSLIWISERGN